MKKLLFMTILSMSLILGGCASQSSGKAIAEHSTQSETNRDDVQGDTQDEEASEVDDALAGLPEPIRVQITANRAGLEDYLAAHELASVVEDSLCWRADQIDSTVYLGNTGPDTVVFNHCIEDPTIGDQRNFIFIQEATDQDDEQIDVAHLRRDDSLISYHLEPGKEYQMLVYIHNNAGKAGQEDESVVAKNLEMTVSIPEQLTPEEGSSITVLLGAENSASTQSSAELVCERDVKLTWTSAARLYEADGSYGGARTFTDENSNVLKVSDDLSALTFTVTEQYPARGIVIFAFPFSVSK